MTIKTQQRAQLAIIGFIFCIMFGLVVESNRITEQYQARGLLLNEIIKQVFDFSIAASDYSMNHNDRALEQMELRVASLSKPLGQLDFVRVDRKIAKESMLQELGSARKIFKQLKDNHNAFKAKYGVEITEKTDFFARQGIEDLSANLSISAVTLVTTAQNLLKSTSESQMEDLRFYGRLVMTGVVVSFVLLSLAVFIFSRRFVSSIAVLKDGAARIAGGDLTSRIELTGSDELTDLTRSLNEMSQKLRESREALENEIAERKRTEESLLESDQQLREREESVQQLNTKLENQLIKLQEANRELESFTYSVSHDLRAPLRHVTGFVEMLNKRDTSGLDDKSRHYLTVISEAATRMSCLIDDLLSFSRMGRGEMMKSRVDLRQLAAEVIEEIAKDLPPERIIQWRTGELPEVTGDRAMLRLVLANLISNAVKYSNKTESALIEVDALPEENGSQTVYVRDNGTGFDMKYVDKLFGLFQRLHSSEEYEGTGVGLANVRRIIGRHGGRTWAEGELHKGATFYFTLPLIKET